MSASAPALGAGSPQGPRGWHRPVRPGALLLVGAVVLLLWLLLMVLGVGYFYRHWQARVALRDQPVLLRLPAGLPSVARISEPVRTRLDMHPTVSVPLHQVVPVEVRNQLMAQVRLKATVPVVTEVTVSQNIPVHTTLETDMRVRSWLPSMHVSLPVSFNLPVRLTVPVRAQLPIDLDVLVSGALTQTLQVPLDTTVTVHPHVVGELSARLDSETGFRLLDPVPPIALRIARADLRVPFNLAVLSQQQP
jgi:hypothetical protein